MNVHETERIHTDNPIGDCVVECAAEKINVSPCRCHADFPELSGIALVQEVNQSIAIIFVNVNHFCV